MAVFLWERITPKVCWLRFEGITDLNGLRQGLWKEYYPTGELRSKGKYKNSKPIGEWEFYFPDKTIEIIGSYNAKGQKIEFTRNYVRPDKTEFFTHYAKE